MVLKNQIKRNKNKNVFLFLSACDGLRKELTEMQSQLNDSLKILFILSFFLWSDTIKKANVYVPLTAE